MLIEAGAAGRSYSDSAWKVICGAGGVFGGGPEVEGFAVSHWGDKTFSKYALEIAICEE